MYSRVSVFLGQVRDVWCERWQNVVVFFPNGPERREEKTPGYKCCSFLSPFSLRLNKMSEGEGKEEEEKDENKKRTKQEET